MSFRYLRGGSQATCGNSDTGRILKVRLLYLWVTKFIAFKIKIPFSAEGVRDETDKYL
jgi:hypothetical protein